MPKRKVVSADDMKDLPYRNMLEAKSLFWSPNYLEPSAWLEHIPFAFWLIENFAPSSLVELGVYNGTSYFSFCQAVELLNQKTKTYGIDSWRGDVHSGFYEDDVYKRVLAYNEQNYSKFSTLIRSTFDEARQYFSQGSIDLLHIDGLHTYEAVKHDFETWLPCLSANSIVVLHDINVRERGFGVFRLWEELKIKYQHFEFDFGFGLGVLAIGKEYSSPLQMLFQGKSPEFYSYLRNLFSQRGASLKKTVEFKFAENELNDLKRTSKKLEDESTGLTEKTHELTGQLAQSNKDRQDLSEQLNSRAQEIKTKDDEIAYLKSQIVNYQQSYADFTKVLDGLQTENINAREELICLKGLSVSKDEVIKDLNQKIESAKEELRLTQSLHEKSIAGFGSRLKSTSEELEQSRETTSSLSKQILRSNQLNKELEKTVFVLNQKIQDHEKSIRQKADGADGMNKRIDELVANVDELRKEKQLLLEKIQILDEEKSDLQKKNESNTLTLHELNKEILLSLKSGPAESTNPKNASKQFSFRKLISPMKNALNRFPRLSYFVKTLLLTLKWKLEGKWQENKYKLDFWKYNRHVPYKLIDDYLTVEKSNYFDREWYLQTYPDVRNDNADPILHYMLHGYFEGRNPGPLFSTLKYTTNYPDVLKTGVNPLLHFLYHGKKEGRSSFSVVREEDAFPYPVGNKASSGFLVARNEDEFNNHQNTELMNTSKPDFLNRNPGRKIKRDVTKIKTVAFIAQPEYFDFHYKEVLEEMYTVQYFSNSFSENPNFFASLVAFDADVNVFFRGELVPVDVLNALGGMKINLSSEPFPKILNNSLIYTEDSLNRFEFFLKIFERPYDYIFHYDEVSKIFLESQGIELSGYFPFPVATELIKPAPSIKKWDIFFSGRSTPHRDQFFGPLKRDFNFLHINHGVVGADLLDFVHQCKISLNIHAENEISWEPRTQFLIAAGSLLISEPLSPTCPLRPGIDFIEVNDPSRMYDTCREVIAHYDDYKHIEDNGRKRVVDVLSSSKTFPAFFNELVEGRFKAASFNSNRLKLSPLRINLKYNGFNHLLTELLHEHA